MARQKRAPSSDKYLVPAVEQAFRVLFRIAESESVHMNLTEICEQTQLHKSTAFCLLHTLQKYGIVQTEGRGKGFTLGPGLIGLSRRFLDSLSTPKIAEPILADLAGKAGATAAFGLIAENNVFVAAKHEGANPIGITMRVGHRFPLTYGCHGKAIAAFLPADELNKLLDEPNLYFHGDPERLDKARLIEELSECRKRWFAVDMDETTPGLKVVAAPVIGPNNRPIGYVAVLGLPPAESVLRCGLLVAEAGKAMSRQLGAKIGT
jgi:DNA-binding IclR family transcriptional regulator